MLWQAAITSPGINMRVHILGDNRVFVSDGDNEIMYLFDADGNETDTFTLPTGISMGFQTFAHITVGTYLWVVFSYTITVPRILAFVDTGAGFTAKFDVAIGGGLDSAYSLCLTPSHILYIDRLTEQINKMDWDPTSLSTSPSVSGQVSFSPPVSEPMSVFWDEREDRLIIIDADQIQKVFRTTFELDMRIDTGNLGVNGNSFANQCMKINATRIMIKYYDDDAVQELRISTLLETRSFLAVDTPWTHLA